MAMKSLKKIKIKLLILYRRTTGVSKFKIKLVACNAIIQTHFDCACISCYPLVSQRIRQKVQVTQSECVRLCLKLKIR